MKRGRPHGHRVDGPPFGHPGPPGDWGPYGPPPEGWGPRGPPPGDWGPRGPPPPEWGPRPGPWGGPFPPGLGPPDPWGPAGPPPEWGSPPPGGWGPVGPHPPPGGWGPHPPPGGWGPHVPPGGWGPPMYAGEPPPPPVGYPPDPYGPAYAPSPAPLAPPAEPPPPAAAGGLHAYPPPGWTGEPMVNPPPEQPQWLKALISVPPGESTPPAADGAAPKPAPAATPAATATTPAAAPPPVTVATAPASAPPAARPPGPLGLLGKRTFEKPPAGRSTGIISFIGPTFGYVEREDLEKFIFKFNAYFGNVAALIPGVRVHFTAFKEKDSQVATDVKVAPGGTENIGMEIYEAVVSQPIVELARCDSTVTLLKNDLVLVNLLTDVVTDKKRATNIKPQIPGTYTHTEETREMGVISSVKGKEGVITSEKHGKLPFDLKENLSDVDFTDEDVRGTQRAIRIRRAKEPLLLTLCTSPPPQPYPLDRLDAGVRVTRASLAAMGPDLQLDEELYEGVVSQTAVAASVRAAPHTGSQTASTHIQYNIS
ncbi:hypothetical protein CRUP_026944 [Coryphaenoides rupestris]|nr:hypothetical protein CRUP_026944 [Coryphaenoides rupestris]